MNTGNQILTAPTEPGNWEFKGLAFVPEQFPCLANEHQFDDWTAARVTDHHDGLHAALACGPRSTFHPHVVNMRGQWRRAGTQDVPLTNEQCDEFRRLPCSFNDMVRAIYVAGQNNQIPPQSGR